MMGDWKDLLGSLDLPEGPADDNESAGKAPEKKGAKSVTLFYEVKGRGGRPVTILADFVGLEEGEIEDLASRLKRRLGTGGSCRGGEILIQGDRRAELRQLLKEESIKVKN